MTLWQRRARIGVAVFGITCAVVVYFAYGERRRADGVTPVEALPPGVVQQTRDGLMEQFSGHRQDGVVRSKVSVTFDDGSTKHTEVRIVAPNRDGRDFVVTAAKGRATKDNRETELTLDVRLRDSDGFELVTDNAVYHEETKLVSAAGPVSFSKGRMSGSGIGMTYDMRTDVLRVTDSAHINIGAESGSTGMDFTAGSAVLDRAQDILALDRKVHVVNGGQVTDADHATALLSPEDDRITFVQLRGQARVEGGEGPLQSMRARDIDLDYADDGTNLERAVLMGKGAATLRGRDGSAGREFTGEMLDVTLAPDASVSRVFGEGDVMVTLPSSADAPARVVQSRTFEAKGGKGGSLTDMRFTDRVVFREQAGDGAARSRLAKSGLLTLELASSGAVSAATFSNDVTFDEDDLHASAQEARYAPAGGTLRLTGRNAKGGPRVSDRRVTIDADSIDVGLETRLIDARGRVKTTLLPDDPAAPASRTKGQPVQTNSGLPGLLAQDKEAKVTADTNLVYDGVNGTAVYSGRAWLWQGETEIRGDSIDINLNKGDLIARGSARSMLVFESGRSEGQGDLIRYVDADRRVTYVAAPPQTPGSRDLVREAARVSGPQGDLRGGRIDVFLAPNESRVQRIEATEGVVANVDTRTFTGASLTYRAEDESYHVVGTPAVPARMEERTERECRGAVGRTLMVSRSTDTIEIDGGKAQRTRTMSSCAAPASR